MITVQNVTSDGYFLSVDVPHMDEIIIVTIVMAIWVYSILQFFRYEKTNLKLFLLYNSKLRKRL